MPADAFYSEPHAEILLGDCREVLRSLPDASVHAVVTSPPYYGLRDYGLPPSVWGGHPGHEHEWGAEERGRRADLLPREHSASVSRMGSDERQGYGPPSGGRFCADDCGAWRGVLGLEPTPDLYVAHLVEIFREIRRVLRPDGTVWLNLGDSYAGSGGAGGDYGTGGLRDGQPTYRSGLKVPATGSRAAFRSGSSTADGVVKETSPRNRNGGGPVPGLKAKDLIGIPWMAAFALRSDGWWLRQKVTWVKTSAMPESVEDRPTSATEEIFLLARSHDYYFDVVAGSELALRPEEVRWDDGSAGRHAGVSNEGRGSGRKFGPDPAQRRPRNWWMIGPEGGPAGHYAKYPTEIPRRAILMSTSERGCCPTCGAPWTRALGEPERAEGRGSGNLERKVADGTNGRTSSPLGYSIPWNPTARPTLEWRPSCDHGGEPVPCVVLDPFLGSGTTVAVAKSLGRRGVGIELSPRYAEIARRRISEVPIPMNLWAGNG